MLLAEVAAVAAAEGVTLQERLDAIAARFGRHVMAERSVRMDPADGAELVPALGAEPAAEVGGVVVASTSSGSTRPACCACSSAAELRLQIRPSGTEPKVKLYGEGSRRRPRTS